jgi:hypothetical protein
MPSRPHQTLHATPCAWGIAKSRPGSPQPLLSIRRLLESRFMLNE